MKDLRQFFIRPWIYLAIIIIGTLLKFYHLDSKIFWDDEIATIKHSSGISLSSYDKLVPVNEIKNISYYDSLLHLNSQPYTIQSQIAGILSDTHLTPAHYVFLTFWHRVVGDDDMDYRLFSVFIFVVSLPFMFLLSKSLYKSALAGWIAVSLYAVSPFINLFAQESRYYILWAFFFILCNYLFLQAIQKNKLFWRIAYAVAAIFALYTSIVSGLFILSHFLYILIFKKELRLSFTIYLFLIFLFYLPWFYFLYTVRETIQTGLSWHVDNEPFPIFSLSLLFSQLVGFVKSFVFLFDTGIEIETGMYYNVWRGNITPDMYLPLLSDLIIFIFIIYATYFLITKASKETASLLVLIVLPQVLFFYITDIVRHSVISYMLRYQILNIVAISLVITYLLSNKIAKGKALYSGLFIGLIILGVVSILTIGEYRCWMTRPDCEANVEHGQLLSEAEHSLLITDFDFFGKNNFMVILNESKAKNIDILHAESGIQDIKEKIGDKSYSKLLVVHASDKLIQNLKSQFGESMMPYKKEVSKQLPVNITMKNIVSQQIWQIKVR